MSSVGSVSKVQVTTMMIVRVQKRGKMCRVGPRTRESTSEGTLPSLAPAESRGRCPTVIQSIQSTVVHSRQYLGREEQ